VTEFVDTQDSNA